MFAKVAQRWKPGVSSRTHLLVGGVLWSFIGSYLLLRGVLLYDFADFAFGALWPVFSALLLGALKERYLLARSARKNIARITALRDNSCLGAVYSLRMWGLVLLMMVAGRLLRTVGFPEQGVALVYLAVGCALFLSSRLFWRQWWLQPSRSADPADKDQP